eukprot:gene8447-9137_t
MKSFKIVGQSRSPPRLPASILRYVHEINKTTSDEAKVYPLQMIWDHLNNDQNKVLIGDMSLGFIQTLVNIVKNSLYEPAVRNALGCLWYLSRANENKYNLATEELGLIPILVRNLSIESPYDEYSFNILINCSLDPSTHSYLLSDKIQYLEFCCNKIRTEREIDPFVAVANISSCIFEENLYHFQRLRIHEIILQRILKYGIHVHTWNGRNGGIVYWCLNFLVDYTSLKQGSLQIQRISWFKEQSLQFFIELLSCKSIEALKSLCIICHLSETCVEYEQLLPKLSKQYPDLIQVLVYVTKATVDNDQGEYAETMETIGYVFGILSMKVLTNIIRLLCLASESNCLDFIRLPIFMNILLEIIDLYVIDAPELEAKFDCIETAGGGGKDEDTLCNTLEIIYHCLQQTKEKVVFTQVEVAQIEKGLLELETEIRSPRVLPNKAKTLIQLILNS